MEDWAEVNRLFDREHLSRAAIARRLGMSRNTVGRLLRLTEPPRYVRAPAGSQLDAFAGAIAAMLDEDPSVRATVIRDISGAKATGVASRSSRSTSGGCARASSRRAPTSARPTRPARSARSTGGTPAGACQWDGA